MALKQNLVLRDRSAAEKHFLVWEKKEGKEIWCGAKVNYYCNSK